MRSTGRFAMSSVRTAHSIHSDRHDMVDSRGFGASTLFPASRVLRNVQQEWEEVRQTLLLCLDL